MDSPLILTLAVAFTMALLLGSVCTVFAYELKFGPRARLRKRVKAIVDPGGSEAAAKRDKGAGAQRKMIQARLKELEDTQKKSKRRFEIRKKIQEAGLDMPVTHIYLISVVVGVIAAGIYILFKFGPLWATPLVAIPVGFFLPTYALGFIARRRQKKFTFHFADAIDVITRGIQSGLPTAECMRIIARESPEPVCTEFRLFTEGQRLGLTLDEALKRATDRMPTPELKFFAIVLNINAQTGGNLAETLGNLSKVLRGRKQMADTIKTKSSEAKSTAMIIGALPFCIMAMLAVISPEYIVLLFTEDLGNTLLYVAGGLMGVGSYVMNAMTKLKM